ERLAVGAESKAQVSDYPRMGGMRRKECVAITAKDQVLTAGQYGGTRDDVPVGPIAEYPPGQIYGPRARVVQLNPVSGTCGGSIVDFGHHHTPFCGCADVQRVPCVVAVHHLYPVRRLHMPEVRSLRGQRKRIA